MSNQEEQRQAATSQQTGQYPEGVFTSDQYHALIALRDTYDQDHDLLSTQERTRLAFVRWLIETGRLQP
jgi:hypothetical protein